MTAISCAALADQVRGVAAGCEAPPLALLIEHDESLAEALSEVLLRGGFKVVHVSDGEVAKRFMKACPFDVVLSRYGTSRP